MLRVKEEDKKPDDESAAHINLKVKCQDGNEVFFRIKRSTQLKKLMNSYCRSQSVEINSISFLFDGRRLHADQTPNELKMKGGDVINSMPHETEVLVSNLESATFFGMFRDIETLKSAKNDMGRRISDLEAQLRVLQTEKNIVSNGSCSKPGLSTDHEHFTFTHLSREQHVYLAKLAEQSERYEEMVKFMEHLVRSSALSESELTVEERNLMSTAYKNVIGSLRAAWRIVSSIEHEENRKNKDHVSLVKDYRTRVEDELSDVCSGILRLLDDHLLPSARASESKVFYLQMKGDYHRYLAEFKLANHRKQAAEDSMNSYKAAQDIAISDFPPTHPIRLGLALNFSVFYYEILNSSDKACNVAKQAFEEATAELDTLDEKSYKDSSLIVQILRENLALWTSNAQDKLGKS